MYCQIYPQILMKTGATQFRDIVPLKMTIVWHTKCTILDAAARHFTDFPKRCPLSLSFPQEWEKL